MKKKLLCLVSNIRAVAFCLAVVCSTISGWATPAKGESFCDANLEYTVTSVSPAECCVSGVVNKTVTDIQIPETVSDDGVSFTVTSIGTDAFYQCFSLSSMTIPSSVTSIEEFAFVLCPLIQVTCLGVTPPVCDSDAFYGVYLDSCKLIVPKYGEGELYKNDPIWSQFSIIEPSGVEDVTVNDNAVEVERYNINGVKLSAPQVGVNIVKMSDGSVKKVVVNE